MDKNKLIEMRNELDTLIASKNTKYDEILEVSKELDRLILIYYKDIGILAKKNATIHTQK